jgi:N-acyl-phosphatidylethanolamine-hydrolysing phospholipase D
MLPFLARRARLSLRTRPGAAPLVPFDRSALAAENSVTWVGHASLLLRMDGVTFLTDPIYSRRCSPLPFAGPARLSPPGVPFAELPRVQFVVLSHDHYDHTDRATIRRLARDGVRFFVPTGMGALVRSFGARADELGWWDSVDAGGVRLHCVPAQHFSGRGLFDRNRRLWAGWVVQGPTRRFYFAGDTGYFAGFREIGERLGPFDLAAVPIGAYLPREIMGHVHVTPEEGLQAGVDARAERILAMHFGTFDLADEPLDEPPRRFLAEARARGVAEQAWVLNVGESRCF